MTRPVTYVLLVGIAWLAIAGGAYLVVTGQARTLTAAELAEARRDASSRLADAIIAGDRYARPTYVSRYLPADPLRITLGIQAIFGGVLLGGLATVIRLLDDIARRSVGTAPEPTAAPQPETVWREPAMTRDLPIRNRPPAAP